MLRKFILYFLVITASGITNAQESLLWKITSPDGNRVSYVLCATELPGVENYDIATPAGDIMNIVNTVAFYNVPDEAEIQNIPVFMKSTGDNTLKGYYKREDRIPFELMVKDKLKTDIEIYYTYKPFYLLQLFRDYDHAAGKDYQQTILLDIALQKTKPTLSLLTIRQIAATMDEIDFATQASVLSHYVNNPKPYIDADAKKFIAYSKQSLTDYSNIVNSTEQSAYTNAMFNRINDLLMRKMEPLSLEQSVLYILNADLVGGETGILKKLRSKGFTVSAEPFKYNLYPGNVNQNDVKLDNNTDVASAFPDDFPAIVLFPTTSGYINPDEINVFSTYEIDKNNKKYKAFTDPFGDLYDMAAADTLFLEYWHELKGDGANFKVKVPIKDDWEKSETPWSDGGVIKKYIYQNNHSKSDLFYSVGYTIYPPNFKQNNKDNFFNQFIKQTEDQLNGKLISQRIISTPAFTGREFTAIVGDSFFVRSQIFLQDNVLYQLLVGGPGDNPYSTFGEAFLNSFRIQSNAMVNWHLFEQPAFNCYLPTPPSKTNKTYTLPTGPMVVNTFTSDDYKELVAYSIIVSAYPPGHKFGNKKSFFDDLILNAERQYIGKAYKTETVEKNGVTGRYVEMLLMNKKTYRMYFFFDGNTVYQFVAGGDAQILLSLNVNRFFNSISFIGNE